VQVHFVSCKKSTVDFIQEMQIVFLHHMKHIYYRRKRTMNVKTGYEPLNSSCTRLLVEVNFIVSLIM